MAGEPVHLTPHEFELLRVLAVERGQAPDPPRAPAGGLGPRLRQRVEPAPREHQPAPPQDRARPRPPALPPDRARRGLPARERRAPSQVDACCKQAVARHLRQALQGFFRPSGAILRRPSAGRTYRGALDVRPGGTRDRGGVLRVRVARPLGAGEGLMTAADIFGLVVSLLVFATSCTRSSAGSASSDGPGHRPDRRLLRSRSSRSATRSASGWRASTRTRSRPAVLRARSSASSCASSAPTRTTSRTGRATGRRCSCSASSSSSSSTRSSGSRRTSS